MKRAISLFIPLGLMACASAPSTLASPCIDLRLDCSGSENILIVGTAEESAELLGVASQAAKKFETTFKRDAAKTVIVPGGVITAEQRDVFEAAGYTVQLPWVSAADKARLRESSIRRQVEEQTKDLPEAIRAQAMQQALAAVQSSAEDKNANAVQAGAFAHELGHMWFIQAFKPADAEAQKGHAYGGWAPDWLDETAAVLLENTALTKKRRKAFKSLSAEEIIPLAEFLSMEHPAAKSAKDLRDALPEASDKSESRAIILTGKEAEAFLKKSGGNKAANFYAQAQAFSDFLLSKAKDKAIYPELSEHLLTGGTMDTWLATRGENWNLPTDINTLQSDWDDWLASQT